MFWSTRKPNGFVLFLILAGGMFGIIYPFASTGRTPLQVNQAGRAITQLLSLSGAPMLPLSKTPPFKNGYAQEAWNDAAQADIPPDLFVRQINQESGFQTNVVSPAGAEGIAQFMPTTAAGLGIDPWNPDQSLQGAAQLMARYQQRYGSYAKALAAYNGGSGNLQAALANCGAAWLSCEPAETQRYVQAILG